MEFSSPVSVSSYHKALLELECLYTASDCLMAYDALNAKLEEGLDERADDIKAGIEGMPVFWLHTRAALMGSFTINWCKLFGSDCNNSFWKQVTLEQKTFRERIYATAGFNYQAWTDYRKSMTGFRNQVTFHLTPYFDYKEVPDFAPAFEVLKVTHLWLREVAVSLGEPLEGNLANEMYFEQIQQQVSQTVDSV